MLGSEFSIAGLISECRMIPSDTAGIDLQLINRRPDDIREFTADRTLVMMHGATFPSASLFDAPVDGESFMDALARAGYDVWAVDARGYGGSTRSPEMSGPPEGASPLTLARTAVRDLRAAVDFVRRHRGVAHVNLLGMSWGATVAGAFAADADEEIAKLVLVTPLWQSRTKLRIDPGGPLGAYRVVSPKAFQTGWRVAAPEPKRQGLIPAGWFEAWEQVTLATDPGAPMAGTIRAPAGAVQDVRDHWTADDPLYDPSAIRCPVLVIAAESDIDAPIDMAHDLFVRLTNTRYRRRRTGSNVSCRSMVDVPPVTPLDRTCAAETETEDGEDPDADPNPRGGGGEPVTSPPAAEIDLPDPPTTLAQALEVIERWEVLIGEALRHARSDRVTAVKLIANLEGNGKSHCRGLATCDVILWRCGRCSRPCCRRAIG
jgi:pimeloyl-ACP methyl ester carboxylesterase